MISFRHIFTPTLLVVFLFITTAPSIQAMGSYGQGSDFMVTRYFTGAWDQTDQESQGILLEVIEQTDGARRAVAYWYTYGSDRKSAWYLGIGDLIEDRIEFELFESSDVGFMEPTRSSPDSVQSIGTMSILFEDCDTGVVTYTSAHEEIGSGSFGITRVSEIMNSHCSGGISDDMHAGVNFSEQRLELTSAREGIDGSGHARYESYPGHMEFEVEVDGLPDGDYHLYVGMKEQGIFSVQNGSGKLEFTSPGEAGSLVMTFDPRGMQIDIHDDLGVVLSSFDNRFEEREDDHYGTGGYGHSYDCGYGSGMGGGMNGGMNGGMRDCVDSDEFVEIEADLINTNVLANAEGEAEWKMNAERVEFSVEIEDIPAGIYILKVGGNEVGIIEARETHFGEVYGYIRFRDPESYGRQPLVFEPRGQKIEVLLDNMVILEVDFPEN